MSSDNVVDFPKQPEAEGPQMPEATQDALTDPGWIGASLFVAEVGSQVFGGSAVISCVPDPEGWHQTQSGKQQTKPGIFVEIRSMAYPEVGASMVVPYIIEAFQDVRHVFAELMVRLRTAEAEKTAGAASRLLVPEKKLLIPE